MKITTNLNSLINVDPDESIFNNSSLIYKCTHYFEKMFKEAENLVNILLKDND